MPGGSFSPNANSAIVTYTPPAGFSGNIDLILTTNDPPNTCPTVSDQLALTVEANLFTANAGANQTVCTGTAANLNGQLTGTNLASWTASVPGGSFSPNANSAIVTYIPPAGFGGNIDLILTTNDPPNACPPVSDQLTLTVETNPFSVSAGANQTVCTGTAASLNGQLTGTNLASWTASVPGGSFSPNANSAIVTYTPPAGFSGNIDLILTTNDPPNACPPVSDQLTLTVEANPFTANAGANQTVCTGTAANLNGQLTGTNLASWTASVPGGSFSPNANSAIVTYTPPAGFSGNIDLILTTNDPPNACPPVSDQLTLTVEANPFTANAGANQTVCTGTAANLNGQLTGTNLASWTASVPGGSFSPNANSAIVTYTPPAGFSGNIDLILTTNDPPNTCPTVSDQLALTVEANLFTANAGANQTVCTGTAANLNGQLTGTNLASWTASVSGGSFSPNANSAIVTYTPPAGFSGNIDLILTTNDPPNACPPVSDQLTLTVEANPFSVSAGANQTVCTSTAANLNGQLTGTNLASWTASVPGGIFSQCQFCHCYLHPTGRVQREY